MCFLNSLSICFVCLFACFVLLRLALLVCFLYCLSVIRSFIDLFVVQVVMNKLWFGKNLSLAVEEPRVHNQVSNTTYEARPKYMLPVSIQNGLRKRGNWVQSYKSYAVVQAISRDKNKLYGKSDPRKHGWAAGF